jgi:hypothetical protein
VLTLHLYRKVKIIPAGFVNQLGLPDCCTGWQRCGDYKWLSIASHRELDLPIWQKLDGLIFPNERQKIFPLLFLIFLTSDMVLL